MLKRTIFYSFILTAVATGTIVSVHGSDASESDRVALGQLATVQGKVTFQRRSTVVPMVICSGTVPCAQPQPYWSVVISANKAQYELDVAFHMGQERVPETVEVSGLVIRSGSHVLIEGMVEKITDDYAIVSQVRRIDLLRDGHRASAQDALVVMNHISASNTGWMCRSDDALGTEFHAQVWYGAAEGSPESFQMRLLSRTEGSAFKEILRTDDVGMTMEKNQIYYRGMANDTVAELQIHSSDEAFFDLPSTLRVTKARRHILGVSAQISLKCSPSQLF